MSDTKNVHAVNFQVRILKELADELRAIINQEKYDDLSSAEISGVLDYLWAENMINWHELLKRHDV